MIVLPDGKICRNLPEQVAENLKKIQEIIHFLDGVNIQDNLVVISDLSQDLTSAELEIVERPVAFIYYNDELYIKRNEDSGNAYFDNVFSINPTASQVDFASNEIAVVLSTGALGMTSATASVYSTSQVDTLLTAKANDNEVAKLTGATFSGSVKAPEILELMSGYSFSAATITNLTKEFVYCGVVKTGDKITFVMAVNLTRTGALGDNDINVGEFTIPSAIGTRLYPTLIGPYYYLDMRPNKAYANLNTSVDSTSFVEKVNNTKIRLSTKGNNFVENTKYYLRYEITLLLSENLAA